MPCKSVETGSDLEHWISSRGLSYQEACRRIGITAPTLQHWRRQPRLRYRKPWLHCLLEGADARLRKQRQASMARDRHRQFSRFTRELPRRQAYQSLPTNVREVMSDLPDSPITWINEQSHD